MLSMDKIMVPVWDTDVMWEESLLMVKDENGVAKAPLLYEPKEILAVTNAAGTIAYEEGMDWEWKDGAFYLTPGSRIFSFTQEELYPDEGIPGNSFAKPDGYILFSEGHFFHDRQIAVTYRCEKGGWKGIVPEYAGEQLPDTVRKLKEGAPLKVLLYGDSISAGANASGIMGTEPYQPFYGELFCRELERRTGSSVQLINPSVGGMDSIWGAENVDKLVNAHEVDLLLVAFGMNDGQKTVEAFTEYIRRIVQGAMRKQKHMEVILIATSTPNPILTDERAKFWGNQKIFKEGLYRLAEELSDQVGIAVADITDMQGFLHSRKRFIDTTGNHVNHPNDFFHRCYAQFLAGMLLEN